MMLGSKLIILGSLACSQVLLRERVPGWQMSVFQGGELSNESLACVRVRAHVIAMHSSDLIDDDVFYCCKRIGRSQLICGKKNTSFPYQFFVGPDWFCMTVTYGLILGASVAFIYFIAVLWGIPIVAVTVLLASITLTFFSLTACSDPGVVLVPKAHPSNEDRASSQEVEEPSISAAVNGSTAVTPVHDHSMSTVSPSDEVVVDLGGSNVGSDANLIADVEEGKKTEDRATSSGRVSLASTMVIPPPRSRRGLAQTPPTFECGRCKIQRPRNSAHCHDCGFCVQDLDHHCPVSHTVLVLSSIYIWNV
jgi:hypothetical protein